MTAGRDMLQKSTAVIDCRYSLSLPYRF